MRKYLVTAAAALSLVGAAPAVAPAHPSAAHVRAVASKTCSAGYTHAVIGGAQKCLRRGEFCARRYASQYRRYGYTCAYRNGYYRLR
jgi:hypothetical protein